jgi:hypothetical protein
MSDSADHPFYVAYAVALLDWQRVETALFRLVVPLHSASDIDRIATSFYENETFGQKLRFVDAIANAVLNHPHLVAWRELRPLVAAAVKERNVLAHYTLAADFSPDSTYDLVLAPQAYVPMKLRRAQVQKYDTAGCWALSKRFMHLAIALDDFTDSLVQKD